MNFTAYTTAMDITFIITIVMFCIAMISPIVNLSRLMDWWKRRKDNL